MSFHETSGDLTVRGTNLDVVKKALERFDGWRPSSCEVIDDRMYVAFEDYDSWLDEDEVKDFFKEITQEGGTIAGSLTYCTDEGDNLIDFEPGESPRWEHKDFVSDMTTKELCDELLRRIKRGYEARDKVDGLLGYAVPYDRVKTALENYVVFDADASERSYVYDNLSCECGLTNDEIDALGLGWVKEVA